MKRAARTFLASMACLLASAPMWSVPPRVKLAGNESIELPLKPGTEVAVIATSPSTATVARKVIEEKKWHHNKSPRGISIVLSVVRSSLSNPLASRYENLKLLRESHGQCPNHNGPSFHIYLHAYFVDEGAYLELDHWSFKAD